VSGVVHQNIHAPELCFNRFRNCPTAVYQAEVGDNERGLSARAVISAAVAASSASERAVRNTTAPSEVNNFAIARQSAT